jgi:hypothetical protein
VVHGHARACCSGVLQSFLLLLGCHLTHWVWQSYGFVKGFWVMSDYHVCDDMFSEMAYARGGSRYTRAPLCAGLVYGF